MLEAWSISTIATLSAVAASAAFLASRATRTRFTKVRTELLTARLRAVRVMRWRLRFSADG